MNRESLRSLAVKMFFLYNSLILCFASPKHVGCDEKLYSSAREDRCGVCRGDGSTCETRHESFDQPHGEGKIEDKGTLNQLCAFVLDSSICFELFFLEVE